jgi:hypothetical protein
MTNPTRLRVGERKLVELMAELCADDPSMRVVDLQRALHERGYAASFERVSRLRPKAHHAALRALHERLVTH